jgi:hypothetical protein
MQCIIVKNFWPQTMDGVRKLGSTERGMHARLHSKHARIAGRQGDQILRHVNLTAFYIVNGERPQLTIQAHPKQLVSSQSLKELLHRGACGDVGSDEFELDHVYATLSQG